MTLKMQAKHIKFLRRLIAFFRTVQAWVLVTNTKAVVGKRNSVASRFLEKNPNVFISGCPCHLAHIATSNVNDAFSKCIDLNVEDVCVDSYYWFDKSTKRKGKLLEYFDFCNQEYHAV